MMKGAKVNKRWIPKWGKDWDKSPKSDVRRHLVAKATRWIRAKGGKV